MRYAVALALLVLSPLSLVRAQGAPPASAPSAGAPPRDAASRAVLALEDQWTAGLVRRDTARFQRLLAPGFVYTENAEVMTRDQVLASVVGSDTVAEAHNEGMVAHRFGAIVVVTGWLVVRGTGASGAFDRRYRFTDTWVQSGGRWRIAAAQDYLAPAGQP